jgi:hypothetical protein
MAKQRIEDPSGALRAELPEGEEGLDPLEAFLDLSSTLLGPGRLSRDAATRDLARLYLGTLLEGVYTPGRDSPSDDYKKYNAYTRRDIADTLRAGEALAQRYKDDPAELERAVRAQIVMATSPDGSPQPISIVAKSIVALWYCAGLLDLTPPKDETSVSGFMRIAAPAEAYASALVWKAVGGNPMGVPGPYYGNWAYPAPTLIAPPIGQEPPPRASTDKGESKRSRAT